MFNRAALIISVFVLFASLAQPAKSASSPDHCEAATGWMIDIGGVFPSGETLDHLPKCCRQMASKVGVMTDDEKRALVRRLADEGASVMDSMPWAKMQVGQFAANCADQSERAARCTTSKCRVAAWAIFADSLAFAELERYAQKLKTSGMAGLTDSETKVIMFRSYLLRKILMQEVLPFVRDAPQ